MVPQDWLGLAALGVYITVMLLLGTFGIVWDVLWDVCSAFILRMFEAFCSLHKILHSRSCDVFFILIEGLDGIRPASLPLNPTVIT